jgi:phosphopantothenoylcysteine decarboxylase/phosphopantothenate--cysteine ligase
MQSKRILLIIGGGIAAYKALLLIRLLAKRGHKVRAVLTRAAAEFVTPLSVGSLTGDKVYQDLFSLTDEAEMGHIELSRDADLVVVAPATADLIAKLANGMANDLASTLLLATDKRVLLAPAMNVRMWHHPATQRNLAQLKRDGAALVGPEKGEMACGEYGLGRLAEPETILARIEALLAGETSIALPGRRDGALSGRHVLITSGPTHEPIDPVRYIANRSSGKQGHAIAAAAAAAGATVTLVSGPVALPDPVGVTVRHVETAREMAEAVEQALPADVFIAAAAVADWRAASERHEKIKKDGSAAAPLKLVENPDILAGVSRHADKRPPLVVGFAAETNDVIAHAKAKLARKGCDLIVANDVSAAGGAMGGDSNTVHLVSATSVIDWPTMSKQQVASKLIAAVAGLLGKAEQPA